MKLNVIVVMSTNTNETQRHTYSGGGLPLKFEIVDGVLFIIRSSLPPFVAFAPGVWKQVYWED
jgi:hypothetical protein